METKAKKILNQLAAEKYIQIGANSFMEALQLNGFSVNKKNDPEATTIYFAGDSLKEGIEFEFENKGGVIVFSIEVNAQEISKNKIVNWVKQKIETIKNRLAKDNKINRVLSRYEDIYGVTIGNFVKGRYKAKDGSLYDEKSLSVEIIGIETAVLNKVAEDLAAEFQQETVLVKNYETNKIYLVN